MAISKLAQIAEHGKTETAQIAASVALLDRGWGKPSQPLEHQNRSVDPAELSDEELAEIIRQGPGDRCK
jgi:hypothetical protein